MLASRINETPVRMLLIKLAVDIHHLRLHPDSEVQPELVDFFRQSLDAARKLLRIHFPVTERLCVIVALAEPSVVHDEKFYSDIRRTLSKTQKLRLIKFKIGSLPAV